MLPDGGKGIILGLHQPALEKYKRKEIMTWKRGVRWKIKGEAVEARAGGISKRGQRVL